MNITNQLIRTVAISFASCRLLLVPYLMTVLLRSSTVASTCFEIWGVVGPGLRVKKISIFQGKIKKFDFSSNFTKKFDFPCINWSFTATSGQIIQFLFKSHHFQTYFLYMISYNNISRPPATLPTTPHDPLIKILGVATPTAPRIDAPAHPYSLSPACPNHCCWALLHGLLIRLIAVSTWFSIILLFDSLGASINTLLSRARCY